MLRIGLTSQLSDCTRKLEVLFGDSDEMKHVQLVSSLYISRKYMLRIGCKANKEDNASLVKSCDNVKSWPF